MLGITGTLVVETGAPGGAPWRALPLGRRVAPRGAAVPPCAPPRAPLDEPPPAAAAAADDAIVFAWESSTARAPPRRRAAGGDGVPLLPSRPMHTPVYWDAGWTLIVSLRHAASLPRAPDAALRPPRMPLRVFCGGMFYLAGFFATVGGALWLGDKSATRRRRLACDQLARLFRAWYGVLNDAALGVPPALPRTPPELAAMGFRPWLPMPDAVGALPYLCPPAGDSTPLRQPPPYALAGGFLYAPGAARGALSHYVLIERLLGGAIARRRAAAAAHEGEETAFWVREQARGADGMALEGVTRTEDNILRNLAYPSGVSSASGGGGGGGASGWLPQPVRPHTRARARAHTHPQMHPRARARARARAEPPCALRARAAVHRGRARGRRRRHAPERWHPDVRVAARVRGGRGRGPRAGLRGPRGRAGPDAGQDARRPRVLAAGRQRRGADVRGRLLQLRALPRADRVPLRGGRAVRRRH